MSLSIDTQREDVQDTSNLYQDARIAGAMHTAAYSSPPPTPTWEDCLREIEDWDWKVPKEPVLDVLRAEYPASKVTREYTATDGELTPSAGLPQRHGDIGNVTASRVQHDITSHEVISTSAGKKASPLSLAQQSSAAAAIKLATTHATPPPPPWIPSPTESGFGIAAPIPSSTFPAQLIRKTGTEESHAHNGFQQDSPSEIDSLTARPATPVVPLVQASKLAVDIDACANEVAEEEDVTMGEDQQDLGGAMEGPILREHQHHHFAPSLVRSPKLPHDAASVTPQSDVALPLELPWQYDAPIPPQATPSTLKNLHHPGHFSEASAEDVRSIGGSNIVSSLPVRDSDVYEALHLTVDAQANSNEIWQTQLREAAKDAHPKSPTATSAFEKAVTDGIPKVFTLAMPKAREEPHPSIGDASSPPLAEIKTDVGDARHLLPGFVVQANDPAAKHDDQTFDTQHEDSADPTTTTAPSAHTTATQKRKHPAKKLNHASDSEQNAPEKEKPRKTVEAEHPSNTTLPNPQDAASITQGMRKAKKSPREIAAPATPFSHLDLPPQHPAPESARSRFAVSPRELDGLSNYKPRVRPSMAKKGGVEDELARLGTPTPVSKSTVRGKKNGKAAVDDDDIDELSLPLPLPGKGKKSVPPHKNLRTLFPKAGAKHPFEVSYGKRHTRGDTKAAQDTGGTSAAGTDELGGGGDVGAVGDEGSEFEADEDGGGEDEQDDGDGHTSTRAKTKPATVDKPPVQVNKYGFRGSPLNLRNRGSLNTATPNAAANAKSNLNPDPSTSTSATTSKPKRKRKSEVEVLGADAGVGSGAKKARTHAAVETEGNVKKRLRGRGE